MNIKNTLYKKYFYNLNLTLNGLNNKFLFYIPKLYKRDLRKDKISIIKINFKFFKSFFKKSYLYDDYKKTIHSRIFFISHYIGSVSADVDLDFYYGNLLKNIYKKIPLTIILINHTNENLKEVKERFKLSNINRVYIDNDFNIITDTIVLIKILKEYILFRVYKFLNYNKFKRYNKIDTNYNFSLFFDARYTYKLTSKITYILDKCKNLKNLVTTFEGHAFEKIIFNYCKKKKIKSFGYFFSVIREYKNVIYFKFDNCYQPDLVLTSGLHSRNDLQKNSPFKKNIEILGSNKCVSKIKTFNVLKYRPKIRVLVCPEGLYSETLSMLKLINSKLFEKKNIHFIFRTHPLINIFQDFSINVINKNIFFSKEKNIQKDFQNCDIILYSGSSACIEATMNGLVPVNFKTDKVFSYDPLYSINKFVVDNEHQLYSLILQIKKYRFDKKFINKIKKIQIYCKLYFQKLNEQSLLKNLCLRKET
jgi:hypothetical protein